MAHTISANLKEVIQRLLGKARYELHWKTSPPELPRCRVVGALHWLGEHGFVASTILDVGASDGRWSRECMKFYPTATYVLYEPQPVHGEPFDRLASEYPGEVIPVKKAVGAVEGELLFWERCALLAEKGFRVIDLIDVMHRAHDNSLWQMDLDFIRDRWPYFDCVSYR